MKTEKLDAEAIDYEPLIKEINEAHSKWIPNNEEPEGKIGSAIDAIHISFMSEDVSVDGHHIFYFDLASLDAEGKSVGVGGDGAEIKFFRNSPEKPTEVDLFKAVNLLIGKLEERYPNTIFHRANFK